MKALAFLLLGPSLSLATPMLASRQNPTLYGFPLSGDPYVFVSCSTPQSDALSTLIPLISDVINNHVNTDLLTEGQRDRVNDFQANLVSTFFTTNDPNDVLAVYQHISAGSSTNSIGGPVKRPNIICLNETVPELAQALTVCDTPFKPTSFTRNPHGSVAGANTDIYLCPSFWDLEQSYGLRDVTHCPTVTNPESYSYVDEPLPRHEHSSSNLCYRYAGDNNMTQTQMATMVHALAHIYAPAPLAFTSETYDLNTLTQLGHSDQLNNANNYAYFAASKAPHFTRCTPSRLLLTFFLVSYAACASFYDLNGADTTHQAANVSSSAIAEYIPAILDDWVYDIAFDANALQANLTALGV